MPYDFKLGLGLCGDGIYLAMYEFGMMPISYLIYTPETMRSPLEEVTFWDPSYARPQPASRFAEEQYMQHCSIGEIVNGTTPPPAHNSNIKPWQFVNLTPKSFENQTYEDSTSQDSLSEEPSEEGPSSATVLAAGAAPPVLPPSVEEAYKKKCIELKRRMNEVEEHNDALRLRKTRLERGIRKMRLERAILLDTLAKRMKKNGADGLYDEESEGSSEGPPTPQEKPLRSKRGHRRPAQSPHSATARSALPQQNLAHHSSSSYSTPIAPHPGPGPFSQTNGNPTSNPTVIHPLPIQHSNSYSTNQHSSLIGLPPQPQQPPSALDLYMETAYTEMASNTGLHPIIGPELFPAYCETRYRSLTSRDREQYERAFEAKMTKYEQDMQIWEENRRQLALRGGEGEGNEDANGEEGEEEEKMEGVEGGFTAVNG